MQKAAERKRISTTPSGSTAPQIDNGCYSSIKYEMDVIEKSSKLGIFAKEFQVGLPSYLTTGYKSAKDRSYGNRARGGRKVQLKNKKKQRSLNHIEPGYATGESGEEDSSDY